MALVRFFLGFAPPRNIPIACEVENTKRPLVILCFGVIKGLLMAPVMVFRGGAPPRNMPIACEMENMKSPLAFFVWV